MIKIVIGFFEGEAELIDYKSGTGHEAEISFLEPCDGFITLGDVTVRLKEGVAKIDLRLIDDGELTPVLILKDCRRELPKLIKSSRILEPASPDSDFIRRISLRERQLSRRVAELEGEIAKISKSVYGTPLF